VADSGDYIVEEARGAILGWACSAHGLVSSSSDACMLLGNIMGRICNRPHQPVKLYTGWIGRRMVWA
jgi:hypothetical protein